jgi:colicin import membrane protein
MRNLPRKAKPHLLNGPSTDKGLLLKAGTFSLLLHIGFLVIFGLSLKSTIAKVGPSVYRVTIRPYAPLGAIQSAKPGGGPGGEPTYQTIEQTKVDKSPKGDKVGEMSKPDRKVEKPKKGEASQPVKKQKLYERSTRDEIGTGIKKTPEKGEKPRKERRSETSLQEAIEAIHKKVALDKIQQQVARREQVDDRKTKEKSGGRDAAEGQPPFDSLKNQIDSSSKGGLGPGVGAGTGTGSGSGIGSGAGGYPIGGVPWGSAQGSSAGSSKVNDYCDMIWAKIKKEWTLPENLQKGKTDLETIIVVVIERDGKIQKSWFEKKSGNALYDQMAMRAIKKAEPLPPIPKEFSDDNFEIGFRFHPD